ncbi:MAG: CueP family metal-binding protein [Gulosibacter sp.]|uniref:CueP family metal-binding protein n=1 Tax=Gulosibacter sp. TaxID=2817531 RepID=UPI003F930A66
MKRLVTLLASASIIGFALAGCAPTSTAKAPESSPLLNKHGLADMSTTEIIDSLDKMEVADRPTDLIASVRPDTLLISDGQEETSLDLPDDLAYVSIAPYLEQTHDCYFHSLTTCRGELANQEIDVQIIDENTREVLVDEVTTTYENGFIGYWLPRDLEGTIQISQAGRSGTAEVVTSSDAATCITTLRLT